MRRQILIAALGGGALALALSANYQGLPEAPEAPAVVVETPAEVPATPAPSCTGPIIASLPPGITAIVEQEAANAKIDPVLFWITAHIESSGNPNAVTGSYKGLFQLSDAEFRRLGGSNIFDPRQNARVAAVKIRGEAEGFRAQYGRQPTAAEIYLLHQQGTDGLRQHLAQPSRLAWQSMYATGEGRAKGPGWSRLAIWGNVPSDVKPQFGSVDNITSEQFVEVWRKKIDARRPAAMKALGLCGSRPPEPVQSVPPAPRPAAPPPPPPAPPEPEPPRAPSALDLFFNLFGNQ